MMLGNTNIKNCNTQSSVPEDGRNHRLKYAELIGIINKPLLLHLVGFLYYLWTIFVICRWVYKRTVNLEVTNSSKTFTVYLKWTRQFGPNLWS